MKNQPQSAPVFASAAVQPHSLTAADARSPEEKAQAKALKKERKSARLRFFFAWCEGCQAFGSGF